MKKQFFALFVLLTTAVALEAGILTNTLETASNIAGDAIHAPGDILGRRQSERRMSMRDNRNNDLDNRNNDLYDYAFDNSNPEL